jgi:hypothetical protein
MIHNSFHLILKKTIVKKSIAKRVFIPGELVHNSGHQRSPTSRTKFRKIMMLVTILKRNIFLSGSGKARECPDQR